MSLTDEWPERPLFFQSFWPAIVSLKCAACGVFWYRPEFASADCVFPPYSDANAQRQQLTRAYCPRCGTLLPEIDQLMKEGLAFESPVANKPFIGTQSGLRQFFIEWHGCTAQLWEYVVSHSHLTLRLHRKDTSKNAFLRCIMTSSIQLPHTSWSASFTLQPTEDPRHWQLIDTDAGVRIVCVMIGVFHDLTTY